MATLIPLASQGTWFDNGLCKIYWSCSMTDLKLNCLNCTSKLDVVGNSWCWHFVNCKFVYICVIFAWKLKHTAFFAWLMHYNLMTDFKFETPDMVQNALEKSQIYRVPRNLPSPPSYLSEKKRIWNYELTLGSPTVKTLR